MGSEDGLDEALEQQIRNEHKKLAEYERVFPIYLTLRQWRYLQSIVTMFIENDLTLRQWKYLQSIVTMFIENDMAYTPNGLEIAMEIAKKLAKKLDEIDACPKHSPNS